MKVAVFMGSASPSSGGAFTFQDELLESLIGIADESKHKFVLICYSKKPDLMLELLQKRAPFKVIVLREPGFIYKAISRIYREAKALLLRRGRVDKLETVARREGIEFIWFFGFQVVALDIPYMTVVWDLQHRLQPWFPEVSAKGIWNRREKKHSWFLRRATNIVVGTNAGKNEVHKLFQVPECRIKILPQPVPGFALNAPKQTNHNALDKFNLPADYLFYPAQFWPHKNHINLLLALDELRTSQNISIPLVLVGSDMGNVNHIRNAARDLNLERQIYFMGFVSRDDLVVLYRSALALTFVSFFGPDNLPPLEAFALGCPVIASNVNGAEEQLGDAALLVDPKSPAEIAAAIKKIYKQPDLRTKLIEKGYERAVKYTGKHYVRDVFTILDDFEKVRRCWGD